MVPCQESSSCPIVHRIHHTPVSCASSATLLTLFGRTPTSAHGKHGTYMPTGIQQARFVFVRRDAHKPPLQTPYDGPFPVVSRHTKHFLLDIGGRQGKVSIDRLKPALLDHGTEITVATRPKRGRPPKSSIGGGGALWRFHNN